MQNIIDNVLDIYYPEDLKMLKYIYKNNQFSLSLT